MREYVYVIFFFQAEDGIRDLVRSRGLGDVYKRQGEGVRGETARPAEVHGEEGGDAVGVGKGRRSVLPLSLIHI